MNFYCYRCRVEWPGRGECPRCREAVKNFQATFPNIELKENTHEAVLDFVQGFNPYQPPKITKLQFLEKRCKNQRRELSRLNKKFAGWWCYLRKVYSEPDSPLAQLTVLQHKFKPVEKERNKLRHENKQLQKRVAELEAALGEVECRLVTLTEENKVSFDSYWDYKVGQDLIVCTGGCATIILGDQSLCPNLYKWLKEKQK